ncbi:Type III restriction enzyme [Fragilaria crotonensis]|nr:Type III restriction enzyme [Fragilaria crotonensis]
MLPDHPATQDRSTTIQNVVWQWDLYPTQEPLTNQSLLSKPMSQLMPPVITGRRIVQPKTPSTKQANPSCGQRCSQLVEKKAGVSETRHCLLAEAAPLQPQSMLEQLPLVSKKLSLTIHRGSLKRSVNAEYSGKPFKRHLAAITSRAFEPSDCLLEVVHVTAPSTCERIDQHIQGVDETGDQESSKPDDIDARILSTQRTSKRISEECFLIPKEKLEAVRDTLTNNPELTTQVRGVTLDTLNGGISETFSQPHKKQPLKGSGNFVRLNMKNNAGSCRGAKRKSKWGRKREDEVQRKTLKPRNPRPVTFDPVDDFLDGVFHNGSRDETEKKTEMSTGGSTPSCGGHQRPCKVLEVKKNGSNKGRKFFACSMPRGEQCDFFEWVDDSAAAAKEALLKKSSFSGFIARQVFNYVDRFRMLTVPELRQEATSRGLNNQGKKQELLMRLSLYVRDELAGIGKATGNAVDCTDAAPVDDDASTSSIELEICDEGRGVEDGDEHSPESNASDKGDSRAQNVVSADVKEGFERGPQIRGHLLELFGYSSFREGQEWAIQRCMSQKRSLLVAPTGFGKSLCYALPAAILEGTCIVISPLISLIDDQLRQLPPKIPAASLSGGMSTSKMASTIDDVLKGRVKILFVSPERLTSASFRRLFKPKWSNETQTRERPFPPVSLLCIDEAHCMSEWAHNFRPSYLRLRTLLGCIKPRSVLAITATAGPPIVRDVCRYLQIQATQETLCDDATGVKILNTERDNIDVFCRFMEDEESRLLLTQRLLLKPSNKVSKGDSEQPIYDGCLVNDNVIVYVWRQRDADVLAEALNASGVEGGIVVYHAGMDSKARGIAQSRFLRGKARVCVATVAFGMGINKVDIDAVVHMNLPSSLEHYLQEIGRAGRDGRPAKAIALPTKDEHVLRHSLAHSNLISHSQVTALLRMIDAHIQVARGDISCNDLTSESLRVFVGIPVESAVSALDCKIETIETLLSLMESDEGLQRLLSFEGRVNDRLAVVLKRTPLQQLEGREQVVRCISKCGRVVENIERDGENLSRPARNASTLHCGLATYQFSVSRCTNLMGPTAEPRHVYAALRRLQSQGELEIVFDAEGHAFQLQISATGLVHSENPCIRSLSLTLWNQFSNQILHTAGKVKTIEAILREVALVEDCETRDCGKSARLAKFQHLASKELRRCENNSECARLNPATGNTCFKELMYDAQSVLQYLRCSTKQPDARDEVEHYVRFDEHGFEDYTSLTVAKFLHGIATIRTALFAQHSTLFGKWRQLDFAITRAQVHQSFGGKVEF